MSPTHALGIAFILACVSGCDRQDASDGKPGDFQPGQHIRLVDVAEETGLNFVHENGMNGAMYFVEPVGSGAALADFDRDGDLDVLLIQGSELPTGEKKASAGTTDTPPNPLRASVWRNDLISGARPSGTLKFEEVTDSSGLQADGYGMGVATGDIDNDGRIDIYVTNFGKNQLWRNISDHRGIRFTDVTEQSGTGDSRWSTSASFSDLDGDGWLDLYVANYVDFRLENHKTCRAPGGRPNYCGPHSYPGESDRLYRNLGGIRFADISTQAGIGDHPSSGLGTVAADFDSDGNPDIYVANDLRPNFLWRNLGTQPLRFEDIAMLSGSAVAMDGRAQASMGLVAGDIDNDGDEDLFMTHLRADSNTLYINDGTAGFMDESFSSGLGSPSLAYTGFGTVLVDFDNDGNQDILVANGAVTIIESQARAGSPYPLAEPNQAFYNAGNGAFTEITDSIGGHLTELEVSRGLAVGDLDNDGLEDVLLSNNNGPARVLMNRTATNNHWVGVQLLVGAGNRDALGAQVVLIRENGMEISRRVATDGSYLSASDPRIVFGLGADDATVTLRVRWPDGSDELWEKLSIDRYHTLIAGDGAAINESSL